MGGNISQAHNKHPLMGKSFSNFDKYNGQSGLRWLSSVVLRITPQEWGQELWYLLYSFSVSAGDTRGFVTPWTETHQAFLSITISQSFLKFMPTESVMPSNNLILCCPLLLLPSIFPSIWVFSSESVLHIRCPKFLSFSFSISPSMNIQDWFPLGWTGWISLQSKGLARVFSNTTVQKHQFFGAQPSSQSNSHIHTWLLEKP